MTLAPGAILGHYRLVAKIDEGGMGVVWQAEDTRLGREVALKVLHDDLAENPDRLARFEREARTLAALDHPNIVVVHSVEAVGEHRFLTMEYLRGRKLVDLLEPGGLPLDRLLALAIPLADAVAAAHAHGVVHGDLKPANVVVGEGDRPKILDFGLARMVRNAPEAPLTEATTETIEDSGRISGTVPYLSPEQIQGEPPQPRSDLFSLGVLFYEMATGARPFRGRTTSAVLAAILRDTPRSLEELRPDLPRQFSRLVSRCLEKDPARRPASAAVLKRDLDAVRRSPMHSEGDSEAIPSIAVLPFADLSADHDQDYFCEGLADEILNAISRIRNLRVVSRTSAFQFKNAALDSREIGDRLGVGNLLEGSVRKAGNRVRINAHLTNTADGYQLWSRSYDRELRDVFMIQDEIAQAVVDVLEVALSPGERRAMRQVATADVRAYEHYLRGRKYFYQYGRRGVEIALQMFSKAIQLDPHYALAFAGIADCRSFLYLNAGHKKDDREQAVEASQQALDLDPQLAEAHASYGLALSLCERHEESEAAFQRAIELNPKLFEAYYFCARQTFAQGKLEQAIALYEKAFEVRPEDYQIPLLAAQIYDDLGRSEDGVAWRHRGIELAEARLEFSPDDVRALYMAANALVVLGQRETGLAWAERAMRIEPEEPMLLYNVACIYSLAGEKQRALATLEQSVRHGLSHRGWILHDSNLDPLRDLPQFKEILALLGPEE
jgi:serine/threonine protein kinase/Tfp pilus assembly protein PilF